MNSNCNDSETSIDDVVNKLDADIELYTRLKPIAQNPEVLASILQEIAATTEILKKLLATESADLAQKSQVAKVWKAIVKEQLTKEKGGWRINDGTEWAPGEPKLMDHPYYKYLLRLLDLKCKHPGANRLEAMLITGPRGIGKSMFLMRLLIEIHRTSPLKKVLFLSRNEDNIVLYPDGSVSKRLDGPPDIVLSDGKDIPTLHSAGLHVLVSSHYKESKEYCNRIKEMSTKGVIMCLEFAKEVEEETLQPVPTDDQHKSGTSRKRAKEAEDKEVEEGAVDGPRSAVKRSKKEAIMADADAQSQSQDEEASELERIAPAVQMQTEKASIV